jgi:hypothetical protein
MVVVSPLVVARSQLLTAVDLFFNDRDPISVHALAGNAREILESLCRLAAVEPITELFLRDHPHKPKKDIYAALNLYRNCFKHVGKTWEDRKDGQAILNQFDDSKNEYLLYVCVEDYLRLRSSSPFPMQVLHVPQADIVAVIDRCCCGASSGVFGFNIGSIQTKDRRLRRRDQPVRHRRTFSTLQTTFESR